ncbi:hypothetical protein ACFXJ8_14070 [Nonomuraea sp. NPDC059194]|uniref:hypothetical protein n=1 Tax=Nonomuraea sp. NPDC059194 TaxID=3346764 RepID=UPI0036938001
MTKEVNKPDLMQEPGPEGGARRLVLMTVRLPREATLADAIERLGLSEEDVDTGYGLVLIDPDEGLYGLRVTEEAGRAAGPTFSDPRIEPYGPPRASPPRRSRD